MDHVVYNVESNIARITLNRPEKLNAFCGSMREDVRECIEEAERDRGVGAIIITGAGRGFCGGGDVRNMARLRATDDTAAFERILDAANATCKALFECNKPTIAAVNGPAAGGGANLALACDIRIGNPSTAFTQSFIKIGLGPDWGGSYLLPRIVGVDRARELLLTGRTVRAGESLALGLLHGVFGSIDLLEVAEEYGARLAASSPLAIDTIKAATRAVPQSDLTSALERERSDQIACFLSPEAARAFADFGSGGRERARSA